MKTTGAFLLSALLIAAIVSTDAARELSRKPDSDVPWYGRDNFPWLAGPFGGKGWSSFTPTCMCKEKGRCYKKKLTCPKKCFRSHGHKGKKGGARGGGWGCIFDCKSCKASC